MSDSQSSKSFEKWVSFYTRGNWGPASGRGCFQVPTGIPKFLCEPCLQFSLLPDTRETHTPTPFGGRCDPWLVLDHTASLSKWKNITRGRSLGSQSATHDSLLWSHKYSRWWPPGNMGVRGHEAELPPNHDGHKKKWERILCLFLPPWPWCWPSLQHHWAHPDSQLLC